MPTEIEFSSKAAADHHREEFGEHLCSQDDRRLKTVTFTDGTPEGVIEGAEAAATSEQAAAEEQAIEEVALTDQEKRRLDFSRDGVNVLKARYLKGLGDQYGLDPFEHVDLAEIDKVSDARPILDRARKTGGIDRGGGAEYDDEAAEREEREQRKQAEKQMAEGCDHARDHCRHGEPEACEYLTESCGYEEEDVDQLLGHADTRALDAEEPEQTELVTVGEGSSDQMEVTPAQAGALRRSWQGYKGAIGDLDHALQTARTAVVDARQAFKAINAIRRANDQADLHPDRLHDLLDALSRMPGDIPEVRTLDHYRDAFDGDGGQGDRGDLPRPVDGWELEADPDPEDVLARWNQDRDRMDGGDRHVAVQQHRDGRFFARYGALDELEATDLHYADSERDVLEWAQAYVEDLDSHGNPPLDADGGGDRGGDVTREDVNRRRANRTAVREDVTGRPQVHNPEPTEAERREREELAEKFRDRRDDGGGEFNPERQGTLDVETPAEEIAEESQVTLDAEPATGANEAVPAAWRREGTTWQGGPYRVQMDSPDGRTWTVRLYGPEASEKLTDGLPSAAKAEAYIEAFTAAVAPDEVSFKSNDPTVPEGAAAATRAIADESGGLYEYEDDSGNEHAPVAVVMTAIGGESVTAAIEDSAALLGFEASRTEPPAGNVEFIDYPFTAAESSEERIDLLERQVRRHQPRIAVGPDVEGDVGLEDAVDVGDRLLDAGAGVVVLVPKDVPPGDVPDRFRVGVPAADFGSGASHFITDYAALDNAEGVHILGGSPPEQFDLAGYGLDVRSVDGSAVEVAAKHYDVWTPGGPTVWEHAGNFSDLYERVRFSLDNLALGWAEFYDAEHPTVSEYWRVADLHGDQDHVAEEVRYRQARGPAMADPHTGEFRDVEADLGTPQDSESVARSVIETDAEYADPEAEEEAEENRAEDSQSGTQTEFEV